MIELLRFIFSSFWIWLGFIMMIAVFLDGIAGIISAIHPVRTVHHETSALRKEDNNEP